MKLITKITLSVAVTASLFFIGCANATKTFTAEELSYRNTSLNDEASTSTPGAKFTTAAAGSSKKIQRAFQDAPPMIPHSTDGMLPITQNNNQCVTCHVDSAPYDKTIPSVPVSHKTNFRPASYALKGENTSDGTLKHVSIKHIGTLVQARFNCSQCHAPQSDAKLITPNTFTPEYTAKDGKFKSSWDDTKFMEDIDTTK